MTRTCGNRESSPAWDPTGTGYRLSWILLTSVLIVMPLVFSAYLLAAKTNDSANTKTQARKQHFACNVGYTPKECQVASAVLRKALARYPVDTLGEWTWVLVRTEDWKRILSERRFDTNNPAFSYLTKRETFLDGSLVVRSSIRGTELRLIFHMPVEDLLDLAIRHELAHALCNEVDESEANRVAVALKDGTPLPCGVIEQAARKNSK